MKHVAELFGVIQALAGEETDELWSVRLNGLCDRLVVREREGTALHQYGLQLRALALLLRQLELLNGAQPVDWKGGRPLKEVTYTKGYAHCFHGVPGDDGHWRPMHTAAGAISPMHTRDVVCCACGTKARQSGNLEMVLVPGHGSHYKAPGWLVTDTHIPGENQACPVPPIAAIAENGFRVSEIGKIPNSQ